MTYPPGPFPDLAKPDTTRGRESRYRGGGTGDGRRAACAPSLRLTIDTSAELEQFWVEVDAWLDQNAPPMVYSSDERDYDVTDWQGRVAFRTALGAKGWLYPTSNPKYGGGGLSVQHAVVITQEMSGAI